MPPGKPSRDHDLLAAQEIARFAHCPEQRRLRYGLGLLIITFSSRSGSRQASIRTA